MPALVVDTNPRPPSSSDASSTSGRSRQRSESASPNRPPVSPITPTVTAAQLAPLERAETQARIVPPPPPPQPPPRATFIPQPPAVAISESENPDAIALRSAISLLQLQREKSKRDLKALQELKAVAVADPQAFARSIQQQQAQATQLYHDILTPTLAGLTDTVPSHEQYTDTGLGANARKDSADLNAKLPLTRIPPIPQPQNIVRCPPIEWSKYHISGEPLDKLHEEQKKWPGSTEPPRAKSGQRAPPHSVSAPYSPFTDNVSPATSTSRPSKNSKKSSS
ncbi:hypothetical protein T440DRAFT_81216 [Plenodomus tracheiphilus IPT5]|uniref:Uncharacterized protein n=1 Tax=Plenodomus tracheiphilus IPT5 TaxID=1408161 RepID=A0A6A7B5Q5_9PLEO|nr:hypothetical protein T440DRAFT_81216 [Plenodomus tracheiphilus IPT5]